MRFEKKTCGREVPRIVLVGTLAIAVLVVSIAASDLITIETEFYKNVDGSSGGSCNDQQHA